MENIDIQSKPKFTPNRDKKLLDQVREVMRYHHYAYKTEQSYIAWIKRFVNYYGGKTHPSLMDEKYVERYLSHLANEGRVAAQTQRQALNAIVFLYRQVLHIDFKEEIAPARSKRKVRPPEVFTRDEVKRVLSNITGTHNLMARVMYGAGLRLMECVRLRIKDVDFGQGRIYVRNGKGSKDRVTVLPDILEDDLKNHIDRVRELHRQDLEKGYGEVQMPDALARKYPGAAKESHWQFVFPGKNLSTDPRTGVTRRHHVVESGIQKAVKRATRAAQVEKKGTCHTLRHSFATHMLEKGVNIRVLQDLMGHQDVKTTEIYTHVMEKDVAKLESPLDEILGS